MVSRRLVVAMAVTIGLLCPGALVAEGGAGDWRFRVEKEEDGTGGKIAHTSALDYQGQGEKPRLVIGWTGSGRAIGVLVTGTHDTQKQQCDYEDWQLSVDATDIPVLGYTFEPAKTELKARLGISTEEFWNLFRKGLRLTVLAKQKCESDFGKAKQMKLVFSLRGSNAAYRYVTADHQ